MKANLESPYHLCQLVHPLLKASGVGHIVFLSSIAGVVALPALSIYSASKGIVMFLSRLFLKGSFPALCTRLMNSCCSSRSYQSAYQELGMWMGQRQYSDQRRRSVGRENHHSETSNSLSNLSIWMSHLPYADPANISVYLKLLRNNSSSPHIGLVRQNMANWLTLN